MSDGNANISPDDTAQGDNSFFTNLVNKVKYKAHKAAYDPNANEFAKKQAEKMEQEKTEKEKTTATNTTDNSQNDDPNKFSTKRMFKKIGSQTLDALKKGFIPFVSIMLAMIVANEMIVYSVPIRIIFFIFVVLISVFSPIYLIILSIFYLLKGGYSYYVNNMTNRPKRSIMPTIYALLPVTTYKPSSSFGSFFMYPFTYPKTEQAAIQLPKDMEQYWEDLKASFKYFDTIKTLPIFADDIKQIKENLQNKITPLANISQPTQSNTSKSSEVILQENATPE
jgi:Ca2+/Na+ antiporter